MNYPRSISLTLRALFYAHFTRDRLLIDASIGTLRALLPYYPMEAAR